MLLPMTLIAAGDPDPAIERDYPYLEKLYLYLHQNPEISFHEAKTSARQRIGH